MVFRGPQNERQRGVVAAFKHAWNNYRRYAWGHDHLKPITKRHQVRNYELKYVMELKEFNDECIITYPSNKVPFTIAN